LKNYIITNKTSNHSLDLSRSIKSKFQTNDKYCYKYVLINDQGNSTVGILKTKSGYCIVDLTNSGVEAKDFLLWLSNIVSSYEDLYCVPNKMGEYIWIALGFKRSELFIYPSIYKLFSKWKFRFFKWGFINMFFELRTDNVGFKIKRMIYFKNSLPKKIYLDTF